MTSSAQSLSPFQWIVTQVSHNYRLEEHIPEEENSCIFQFGSSLGESFVNSATPFVQCGKTEVINNSNNSVKTLQNILNANIFKKPFVIWNANTTGENILHFSNCVKFGAGANTISYSKYNSEQTKISPQSERILGESTNRLGTCDTDPTSFISFKAKNRMVTSTSNNVMCNVRSDSDKKRLKNYNKQLPAVEILNSGRYRLGKGNPRENLVYNRESDKDQIVKHHTLNSKYKTDKGPKRPVVDAAKGYTESVCDRQQRDCKKECSTTTVNEIQVTSKGDKGQELQEVEKILENVLYKTPSNQNISQNEITVAKPFNGGGSDTGYSSRCSTPPAVTAMTCDPRLQNELSNSFGLKTQYSEKDSVGKENRLHTGNIPFIMANSRECRSQSPSDCSESSSQGSYQPPKPKRKYPNYQDSYQYNNSYSHNTSYLMRNGGDGYSQQRQNGYINQHRPLYQGNNQYRSNMLHPGYHRPQHFPSINNTYYLNPQNASQLHNEQGSMGKFYVDDHRQYNQHGDVRRKNSWGYNQRYQNGRNRQNSNYSHGMQHQNQQHHHRPGQLGGVRGHNCGNHIYYEVNSQFDVREFVGSTQRKLSGVSGNFTSERDNVIWSIDHRAEATIIPPELLNQSAWDDLSRQVWDMFTGYQQLYRTFATKLDLKDRIYRVIANVLPTCRLFVVGSSLSGFGANNSDVDMCLMVTARDLDQRNEAQAVLRLLQRELNNCGFVEKMELITAKVPILKFRDSSTGIDVDLNCNNSVGIRNTHLLNAYAQLDWRVRPLALVVKLWAQFHHINNAKDMTISSYSLVLMVIHYLQYGTKTPLLPCLHEAFPDKFNSLNHIFKTPVTERIPLFISKNKQTLGELFLGFLEYFTEKFTYIDNAMSVRLGSILPAEECKFVRTKKNDSRMWKYLCIEEPFDRTNTARSVYDEVVFEKVKSVFRDSYKQLKDTKDLNSIFSH